MQTQKEKIVETVNEENVDFINLQFTDIFGTIKNCSVPANRIEEVLHDGLWFDGSSIEGFMRISESDMIQMPDADTFHILPWPVGGFKVANIISDIVLPSGEPFEGDPRYILRKTLKKVHDKGMSFNVAPELEFFLFETDDEGEPTLHTPDVGGYFDLAPFDRGEMVRHNVSRAVDDILDLEMSHHEVAPGQHEINFTYKNALQMADSVQNYKYALKQVATSEGLHATFMPKPITGVNGSGMHTHQSLANEDGENLFYDEDGQYFLSEMAESYIAGILKHIRGITAILNPTVNSYKRLTPGYEAPVYLSWGQRNRSALVRIPMAKSNKQKDATRIELRCPDPSSNPYLAFAAMLEAGLDGLENDYNLEDPVSEDVYEMEDLPTLPSNLGIAIEELEKSEIAKEVLGNHIHPIFVNAKQKEWDDYRITVSDWEIDKYLKSL